MAHILIVDDEEILRDLLSQVIGQMGHSCDTAANGEEGCQRVRESRASQAQGAGANPGSNYEYDLIITDIRMPEMDGLKFLRSIQDDVESRTPCMIITALADEPSIAVQAVRLACDFLSKPFEMDTIREAVRRALEMREAWKARRDYRHELESKLQEKERELLVTYDGTLLGFAAMLEGKDQETRDHCLRLKDFCQILAGEMGLTDSDELRALELGAMLHDIGKAWVPDSILKKPGKLTEEEWASIRKHPEHGAEFVRDIPFLRRAEDVILNHHERWDGGGYPRGLAGEDIPLVARIFALADAFDAIVSKRCYKDARPFSDALDEVRRGAGTHFDPRVAEAFERAFERLSESHRKQTSGCEKPPAVLGSVAGNGRTRAVPSPVALPASEHRRVSRLM